MKLSWTIRDRTAEAVLVATSYKTTKRPRRRRSGRRLVRVTLPSLFTVLALASPAEAATFAMADVRYNSNCGVAGSSMNSMFKATATNDGSSKVDITNLKQSARIYLPAACPPATKICLDGRFTAHTKSGGFTSSSAFGTLGAVWQNYHEVIPRIGNEAKATASTCASIYDRSKTITANQDEYTHVLIWSGSYYKLADYKWETRVRWLSGGTWRTGSWTSFYKKF
jgi:hypothetical protein